MPYKGEGSSHCRILGNKCPTSFLCHLGRASLLFLPVSCRPSYSTISFPPHPASALSISLPLIIPYLYLGPFGSQWRYLARSDWAETPPNLITQSVGQGTKEVATAVSLRTACTFLSFNLRSPLSYHPLSIPSFFSPFCPLFAASLSPSISSSRSKPGEHWRWGIKPLPIRL